MPPHYPATLRREQFRRSWRRAALRITGLVASAALIGVLVGYPLTLTLTTIGGLWLWQLLNLYKLDQWLTINPSFRGPEGFGLWAHVYSQIERRLRRGRHVNRRMVRLLRTVRRATGALPDGLLVLDQADRMVWLNRAAESLLGLNSRRDLGAPVRHLLRLPSVLAWLGQPEPHEPLLDQPSPVQSAVRISLRLVRFSPELRLLLVRDMTALLRAERARQDFIANVSHELRTPLTVINGYVDEIEPEEAGEFAPIFAELKRQAARMTQLVDDLLMLSRFDAAHEPAPHEPIVMADLIRNLAADALALSQQRHRITVTQVAPLDLLGGAGEVRSAFMNLISNAIRYTPDGGRIELRWGLVGELGCFCVVDTGIGIAGEHINRLTERFYRVSNDRSRSTGGTGLGLAIVKHILELHEAQLEIDSKPGHGSTFRCLFPASRLRPTAVAADTAE